MHRQVCGLARLVGASRQTGARCEMGDLADFPSRPGRPSGGGHRTISHDPAPWDSGNYLVNTLLKVLVDARHRQLFAKKRQYRQVYLVVRPNRYATAV